MDLQPLCRMKSLSMRCVKRRNTDGEVRSNFVTRGYKNERQGILVVVM